MLQKADTSFKAGIKRKQKRGGQINEYLRRSLLAVRLHDFALSSGMVRIYCHHESADALQLIARM